MDVEKKRFWISFTLPLYFLLICWLMKLIETGTDISFVHLGVYPNTVKGLIGIITAPFVHGDFNHLIDNSVSFLILGVGLFYFYSPVAYKVFFLSWLFSGVWLWIGGRPSWHIGASGLIYAMASFLFFSGIIRKYIPLMALSLLVVFLYGSMVWGVLPIFYEISWEGHLFGALSGLILSVMYRKYGPTRKKYSWETEEEPPDETHNYWEIDPVTGKPYEENGEAERER